jgi:hypothetical protein
MRHFLQADRMSSDDLVLRQQRLLARNSQLRSEMADVVQGLRKPLAIADAAHACLKWLHQNPILPLVALLAMVLVRPQRVISLGGRAWWVWSMFNRVKTWLNAPLG